MDSPFLGGISQPSESGSWLKPPGAADGNPLQVSTPGGPPPANALGVSQPMFGGAGSEIQNPPHMQADVGSTGFGFPRSQPSPAEPDATGGSLAGTPVPNPPQMPQVLQTILSGLGIGNMFSQVDHNPFQASPTFTPVDHDPFAGNSGIYQK